MKIYKVSLTLKGNKPEEFLLCVKLSGYFTIQEENMTEELKHILLTKNSVAILLPYLRSQVSLLTAQPETDTVILPILNVNNFDEH